MTSTNCLIEVKEAVGKWWCNLQFERKCSSTHTVKKIISNSPPEVQVQVKVFISEEIEQLIGKCLKTNDLKVLQCACNAINGCFDNFIHAVEAVSLSFSKIITFIDFGLTECQNKLNLRTSQKNAVLELLHSLSRILILVLKLRRVPKMGECGIKNLRDCKYVLITLISKIGLFLMMEDILIDTKNNLSMAGILIREIVVQNKDKLIQYHKNFMKSIPVSLLDEECKLNILKFLTCSGIINTWSVDIIGWESIGVYLKFFISLCEKYSSETPIVLNTSRTLLLLIKHEAFKEFIDHVDHEKKEHMIGMLLSCIFMLLEHPVACVRHSAKDFLQLLATHPSLHSVMIESVFKLPTDKRSYFISIGSLANEIGSDVLIKNNPKLPAQMIQALCDPTIVSHVSLALEFVIVKDSLSERNFPEWCETYVVPLLISLQTVLPIVAADIEKLLEKAFKKHPNSVVYVINKWSNPTSGEELRYMITALKISQKQGVKLKNNLVSCEGNNEEKELISERLLEHCFHQRDDDIRISAFSLIVEAHKSTKLYSERDFKLIFYFLKYNLNNQQPATRQKILGLIRKMLVRFSESQATLLKASKNQNKEEKSKCCVIYNQFLDSLVEFCFANIFTGCNFNRLNTVLNILVLAFENVKGMAFPVNNTHFYWTKFLIALESSYEENKDLAVTLMKKLNHFRLSLGHPNFPKSLKIFYNKAFSMCTHMEPPDVLTGSYLLQTLNNLPSSKEVLSSHFTKKGSLDDVHYLCIQVLMETLSEHIELAKLDLMTAALIGPMYGALFAIRLTFKNLDLSSVDGQPMEKSALETWGKVINKLVVMCFEMTRIVGCVVNSSSPEGHLPMDFQTDLENLLSSDFEGKCKIKDSDESSPSKMENQIELIQSICTSFFNKCNKLESAIESRESEEPLRTLNALLRENELLMNRIQVLGQTDYVIELLGKLANAKSRLEKLSGDLSECGTVREWQPTAQVLLLCAWRSIKEASLFLGDLFTKLPIERAIELGLLTKETVIRVGEELKILLCEIKHRGAFEQSYIGFTHLVNSLWKCSDKNLSGLPRQWLEDIIRQLESPLTDQKVKLCSTRRSAGLPFLVQAIICSEVSSLKSTTPSSLHTTMKALLNIIENGVADNPEAKIHALNVLRALFKHAQLGEHVASYVSKALMVAIRGSRAATWSERNSSSLLFSSLVIRIFGVSRSREEISKKNRMTSRTFFQRYSDLYDFLLSEMELVHSKENHVNGIYPKPSLYLVLLILGRLYPPPTEDPGNIDLSEFLPYIDMSRRNPIMKIRELGARALVPLISLDRLKDELDERFLVLSSKDDISENERHGILLQIKELLSQSQDTLDNLVKQTTATTWVENTKWMFERAKETCLVTLTSLVKVFHILHKNFPHARETIGKIIKTAPIRSVFLESTEEKEASPYLGLNLFLENFYFLHVDILAREWLTSSDFNGKEEFFQLLTFLLKCRVSEVQSIPLRILNHVLKESVVDGDDDDDDFAGIGVPLSSLFLLETKENVTRLEREVLERSEILSYLTKHLENSRPLVIRRIWLSVWSGLFMKNVVHISPSGLHPKGPCLRSDFTDSLVTSKDKGLSTGAIICGGVYYMEEVFARNRTEKTRELADRLCEFSSSDADVKERLAVAKVMNRCFGIFPIGSLASDPMMLKIWMIPLKLLADEDPRVRTASGELVRKIQEYVIVNVPKEDLLLEMKTLDWPHLPLVSLKAQECLLDCYINIFGEKFLQNLIAQMLLITFRSSFIESDSENDSKDEFGVFEKGNPNPFCEDFAFSGLMCQKLTELGQVTDLKTILCSPLSNRLGKFIAESLDHDAPNSLLELIEETFTSKVYDKGQKFSEHRVQMRNLIEDLGLKEMFL